MKIKTVLIGCLISSSTLAAESGLSKQELVASAPSLCIQAASENYGVSPEDVQLHQEGKKVRYSRGLKGALLVLEIGGGIGKRTCIARKNEEVSFTRTTGLR